MLRDNIYIHPPSFLFLCLWECDISIEGRRPGHRTEYSAHVFNVKTSPAGSCSIFPQSTWALCPKRWDFLCIQVTGWFGISGTLYVHPVTRFVTLWLRTGSFSWNLVKYMSSFQIIHPSKEEPHFIFLHEVSFPSRPSSVNFRTWYYNIPFEYFRSTLSKNW